MDRLKKKKLRRQKIRKGIRHKITGTAERPRLNVYRSNKEIYVQVIDDDASHTIAAASTLHGDFDKKKKTKSEQAREVGKKIAELAKAASVEKVVFDRNAYIYHGRIKELADGAREGGLKF